MTGSSPSSSPSHMFMNRDIKENQVWQASNSSLFLLMWQTKTQNIHSKFLFTDWTEEATVKY